MELENIIKERPCVKVLLDYQQADENGIMVLVSRQAIHETVDLLTQAFIEGEKAERERLEKEVNKKIDLTHTVLQNPDWKEGGFYAYNEVLSLLSNK